MFKLYGQTASLVTGKTLFDLVINIQRLGNFLIFLIVE